MVHFTPTKERPRRDGGGWLLRRCCRWPQLRAAVCDGRPKHIASASALRRLFELQRRLRRRSPCCNAVRSWSSRTAFARGACSGCDQRRAYSVRWAAYDRYSCAAAGNGGGSGSPPSASCPHGSGCAACGYSATYGSGGKLPTSNIKNACLRARCGRAMCEMGPSNPVLYVGTKTPGLPGFSSPPLCVLAAPRGPVEV